MPFSALNNHSAPPRFGGSAAGWRGSCGTGVTDIGVDCAGAGVPAGFANCASSAARFAVGGALLRVGGAATGRVIGDGNWKGGGWNGAGAGTEDACAGEEMRFRRSAKDAVGIAAGAGWVVGCCGGLKLASS